MVSLQSFPLEVLLCLAFVLLSWCREKGHADCQKGGVQLVLVFLYHLWNVSETPMWGRVVYVGLGGGWVA